MHAKELVDALQALIEKHGDLPVVYRPSNVCASLIKPPEFDNWCKYWSPAPDGKEYPVKGKVFLFR